MHKRVISWAKGFFRIILASSSLCSFDKDHSLSQTACSYYGTEGLPDKISKLNLSRNASPTFSICFYLITLVSEIWNFIHSDIPLFSFCYRQYRMALLSKSPRYYCTCILHLILFVEWPFMLQVCTFAPSLLVYILTYGLRTKCFSYTTLACQCPSFLVRNFHKMEHLLSRHETPKRRYS